MCDSSLYFPLLSRFVRRFTAQEFRWSPLAVRILTLALVLGAEALGTSVLLDGDVLAHNRLVGGGSPFTGLIAHWGAWTVKGMIGFAALFATFAFLKHRAVLSDFSTGIQKGSIRPAFLALHFLLLAAFGVLSALLYGDAILPVPADWIAVPWAISGMAAGILICLALFPATLWAELFRRTGSLWIYCLSASALACVIGAESQRLWEPASKLTFAMVRLILSPLFSQMILQPDRLRIGTERFTVIISPQCSGLEGVGLLLIFGLVWLFLFRDEIRFPQSLALLPIGVVLLFSLNAVRLAALILIGNAGAKEIAAGGFHSQAGWIAFNSVALGLSVVARRIPWFAASGGAAIQAREPELSAGEPDTATSAYLLPLLAILAAGFAARAVSSGFEWFYSVRCFAALAALWAFRKSYSSLEWKLSWTGPLIGVLTFGIWIGLDRLITSHSSDMPTPLASAAPGVRILWIALRILGAVVTVPIAEELAFRGYLLRRLISPEFESISFRSVTWLSVGVSSSIFGVLHGGYWIAGIVAGVLYSFAAKSRGRLTDAMIAHSFTNLLLAAYVLAFHAWNLW